MTEPTAESPVPGRPRPLLEGLVVPVLMSLATLAVWPPLNVPDPIDISVSWRAALQLAASLGLHHGSDVLFTYGPLGYLAIPRFYEPATGAIAIWTTAALSVGVMASVALVLRSRYSLVATVVGTLVAARFLAVIDPMVGPVMAILAWASVVLYQRLPFRGTVVLILAASALGGVAVLMKFNIGISVLAIPAAVSLVSLRRRPWVAAVAVLVAGATLVAAWLVAGQELGDLRPFLSGSLDLASGYSAAMGLPIPDWQVAAAALSVGAVMLGVLIASRDLPSTSRFGLLAAAGSVAFFAWKHGVVRQGLDGCFAELVLIGLLAIDWRRLPRSIVAATVAVPIALFAVSSPDPLAWVGVDRSVATAADQLATALVPGAATERARILRDELRSVYRLPSEILAEVDGQTTHVDAWETAIVVAYPEIDWQPEPVFQSYAAYTRGLDRINADSLRREGAPDRILRPRPRAIDGRYWPFESPEATLEMFCRYREVAVTMRWQVVARGSDRCGQEEVISVVRAPAGSMVAVPASDEPSSLIGVRITGLGGALESLSSSLYRGPIWTITLDDRSYRLVPGTASGPLLIGSSADLGYANGYAISRTVQRVGVASDAPWTMPEITYTFFRIPITD